MSEKKPTCDIADLRGIKLVCTNEVTYGCGCRRCNSGEGERFHSCAEHTMQVGNGHMRVRGSEPSWSPIS